MLNPIITEYVEVKNLGSGNFIILAKTDIPIDTIVEICPVAILTKRNAIILSKMIPSLSDKIIIDESVISREYKLLVELNELELDRRLDRGEITADDYKRILISKMNPSALLESKSHVLILGNGLLYTISESPNLVCEYHAEHKVCIFKTVRHVIRGTELTYYR